MSRLMGTRIQTQTVNIILESEAFKALRSSINVSISKAIRLLFEQFLQTPREDVIECTLFYLLASFNRNYDLLALRIQSSVSSTDETLLRPNARVDDGSFSGSYRFQLINQFLADLSLSIFAFLGGKLAHAQRETLVHALSEHHPIHDPVIRYFPEIQLAVLVAFRHISSRYYHTFYLINLSAILRSLLVIHTASYLALPQGRLSWMCWCQLLLKGSFLNLSCLLSNG